MAKSVRDVISAGTTEADILVTHPQPAHECCDGCSVLMSRQVRWRCGRRVGTLFIETEQRCRVSAEVIGCAICQEDRPTMSIRDETAFAMTTQPNALHGPDHFGSYGDTLVLPFCEVLKQVADRNHGQ